MEFFSDSPLDGDWRSGMAPLGATECNPSLCPAFSSAGRGCIFLSPRITLLPKKILIVGICPMSFRKSVMRTAHNASAVRLDGFSRRSRRRWLLWYRSESA